MGDGGIDSADQGKPPNMKCPKLNCLPPRTSSPEKKRIFMASSAGFRSFLEISQRISMVTNSFGSSAKSYAEGGQLPMITFSLTSR